MANKQPDPVERILNRIKSGEDEHRTRITRYNKSYEVYRAGAASRPKSLEPWQSRARVPYGMQVIDTALVNIVQGKPRGIVKARRPEFEASAKAMQAVLDYYVREDHLVEKQPVFVQQGLIYGVTVAKNHWLYKERIRKARDEYGEPQPFRVIDRDGPTFEPWNIYDCWWEPGARDVDDAAYVVLRSYASKEALESQAHNPETGKGLYRNLDELFKTTSDKRDTTAQESYLGGMQERQKDKFELLEVWSDDHLWVIGNRQVLLRDEPNPYWHGQKPIVVSQVRPDLFEMQGIPETELVDHIQQVMWTLQNMTIDNLHLTTMRGITYREGGVTDPNALVLKPRFKWGVMDHDDVKPFEIQPLSSDVFNERQRLLADLQLVTGINPYISGADLQTVDQNTATGVTALQEVANRLLRFKAAQLQNKGYQRMYEQWGDMTQQFLDHDVYMKIVGDDGQEGWVQHSPEEVQGHFMYVLEGSEESLSKQAERSEAVNLLNSLAPLAQVVPINWKLILEKVAAVWNFPNPEALFQPPQQGPPVPPLGPGQQQQQNGQQPMQPQVDPRIVQAIQGG